MEFTIRRGDGENMRINGNVSLVIRPKHLELLEKLLRNAIVGIDTVRSGIAMIADSIEAYKQGVDDGSDFIEVKEVHSDDYIKVVDGIFSTPTHCAKQPKK